MASDKNNVAVLCERCRPALRLPKDEDVLRSDYSYHEIDVNFRLQDTWPGLPVLQSRVSKTGCAFCRLLQVALSRKELAAVENPITLKMRWMAQRQQPSRDGTRVGDVAETRTAWLLDVQVLSGSMYSEALRLSLPIAFGSQALAKSYTLPPLIESSVLEEGPVGFIRASLNHCADHFHQNTKTPDFLPTRLIDVTGEFPRIVELRTSPEEPPPHDRRYLALSYCWGGGSQLLLTRESEQEFQTGFPVEKLSPTQRDTIALAKALSIPYVWIDALCIRQHDRRDWESEAPTMGKIYSGAYLTVCAASSSSCQEGYLDRNFVTPITVPADPVSDPSGSVGGTYIFQPIMWLHNRYSAYDRWGQFSLSNSQWVTRAWTYQEMMMSTRLLYFTTSGMHFNCGQCIRSEYPYQVVDPNQYVLPHATTSIHDGFGLESMYQLASTSEIYREWTRRVVIKYGGRTMTEPTDAFPSLSGLTNIFATLLQDEYIAGLWKQRLPYGLTWLCDDPAHDSLASLLAAYNNPSPYISPPGAGWPTAGSGEETSRARIASPTADRCGELLSASLTVRTRVYPFRLGCVPNGWKYQLPPPPPGTEGTGGPCLDLDFDFRDAKYRSMKQQEAWQDFVLVLIATYRHHPGGKGSQQPYPVGLIACPADDGVRYIRIGRFDVYNNSDENASRLLEVFKQCDVKEIKMI
ncbi:heterokaryon incompatibility protein-domain-containing protein [Apiospora arundinis]|uniref:Heterokaryon incompatibility protein-domain-containing protein n=1 Tax=Apiospora arundinis TaxID=335852 RepID=A0ABR2I5C0_9PEZI